MMLIVIVALIGFVGILWYEGGGGPLPWASPGSNTGKPVSVAWVDGDSGTIDGKEFRLHGVDAPEGSPSRAMCARERQLSAGSREAAQRATWNRHVVVSRRYGKDRYDRELVDLSVDGQSVARKLIASGHVKRWNFEAGQPKPNWCN